jgi:hypothetical protein
MKKMVTIACTLLIAGCTGLGHVKFYDQVAPTTYAPTSSVMVFEYSDVSVSEIYDLLYSDYLIIGKSGFNGRYEDPERAMSYAKSIGADVFISAAQFDETRTSFVNLSTPTTSTTDISGTTSDGYFSGSATTYGTRTTTVPISVNRYDQYGIYLKNVNDTQPIWEQVRSQYGVTANNELSGIWGNENYRIEIFQSGEQLVAFITQVLEGDRSWSKDQLKMFFGVEMGVGIYMMGSKAPMPAEFGVNKFGHFEVRLLTDDQAFSFARQ